MGGESAVPNTRRTSIRKGAEMITENPGALSRRRWLGWGLGVCLVSAKAPASAARAADAPRLLLARDAPDNIEPHGYLVSEKYDGVRALWDGRSLRFRSGLAVPAPTWFTSGLPEQPLDGELWFGRGRFEAVSAAVRRHEPREAEWRALRYMLFEIPGAVGDFAARAAALQRLVATARFDALVAVEQTTLPDRAALRARLDEVVRAGGEGLMLHRADAPFESGRSDTLLKLKPIHDADAVVIGHIGGRGKHAGRLGALWVRNAQGMRFALGTGFSDAQRADPPAVGALVTYTYRGTTPAGTPRFASFLRVRSDT
jgi:DNA ligase-1